MLKTIVLTSALALALVGCVTPAQLAMRQTDTTALKERYYNAQQNSVVMCMTKLQCEKAFSLPKIFVQDNADMKLQSADNTTVATANPIRFGEIGLTATIIPGAGDSGNVRLSGICKGLDGDDFFSRSCLHRLALLHEAFKSYIETRMR